MVARLVLVLVILASVSPGLCSNSETSKICPPGWTKWRNNCYRYYSNPRRNFDDSEDFCASVPLDGDTAHLASVESDDENNFLFELWKSLRGPLTKRQHARIGYTDSAREGTWQWTDGSSSTYTAWDGGQPDNRPSRGGEDCAVMWKILESSGDRGRWADETCDTLRPFFCKFGPLN